MRPQERCSRDAPLRQQLKGRIVAKGVHCPLSNVNWNKTTSEPIGSSSSQAGNEGLVVGFAAVGFAPPMSLCAGVILGIYPTIHPFGRSGLHYLEPRKRGSIQAVVQREKLVISVQRVRADHKICKNAAETGITMPFAPRSVRLKSTTRSAPDGFVEIPINGDSIVVEECVEECFVPTRTGQQLRKDRGRNDHPPRPSALSKSVVS